MVKTIEGKLVMLNNKEENSDKIKYEYGIYNSQKVTNINLTSILKSIHLSPINEVCIVIHDIDSDNDLFNEIGRLEIDRDSMEVLDYSINNQSLGYLLHTLVGGNLKILIDNMEDII